MKIAEILSFLDTQEISYTFEGCKDTQVERFSSLSRYQPGTFTWIKTEKNIPGGFDLAQLTLVFTKPELDTGKAPNIIRTAESKRAFFSTIEHFYDQEEERPAIGQFTYIGPKVKLGKHVRIGHNCTLDGDITIGDDTIIWNNVVMVNRVKIGSRCEIQSGTIIGHDGYGYAEDLHHKKHMVKHYGGVQIGDDVTILENSHVTRGTIDDTVIEDGCKIDAQAHISHNCHIGKNVALAMPCTLCGSVTIGENSYISGATILNQLTIGKDATVGIGSVVLNHVADGQHVFGYPARKFLPNK